MPGKTNANTSRRKGRPPGVKLAEEQKRQILSFVEAGGSVDAAAWASGIAPRTLRELRQRSRGQHPKRSALPALKPFFRDLDQAIGRRLLTNEIWLSDNDPKSSLKYLRGRLDPEGEDEEPLRLPTPKEVQGELDVLISSGAYRVPRCPDEDCSCAYHQEKGKAHDDERHP
jgi:hypothetical protein